jgi:purine-binding chemotaxis protein CheW
MATEKDLQLIGFRVGRESYGVPISMVREIVRALEITPVPDAPSHVEGVVNLRGRIIPVIDLRKRFHETEVVAGKKNRILVVEVGGRMAGLLVDAASEVLKIPRGSIEAPPEVLQEDGLDYITGLGKREGRLIVLVDLEKLMQRGELRCISDVTEMQSAGCLTPSNASPAPDGDPLRGNGSEHGQL